MNVEGVSNFNGSVSQSTSSPPQTEASTVQVNREASEKSVNPANNLEFSENLIAKGVEQANQALKQMNRRIDRSVHAVTKAVMYKIVDTETKEVLREFPPEKIQDMIAKMWELAGLFVDERA